MYHDDHDSNNHFDAENHHLFYIYKSTLVNGYPVKTSSPISTFIHSNIYTIDLDLG